MKKGRTGAQHVVRNIPLALAFVFLILSWAGFTFCISIGEVLIRRKDIGRFLLEFAIFQPLVILTAISLYTACSRSPGHPRALRKVKTPTDYTVSPHTVPPRQTGNSSERTTKGRAMSQTSSRPATIRLEVDSSSSSRAPDGDAEDDDIPLRFLRNDNWVASRGGKDRPSPLPLPKRFSKQQQSRRRDEGLQNYHETSNSSCDHGPDSDSDELDNTPSTISPFPLGVSPFVPKSAEDARGGISRRYGRNPWMDTEEAEPSESEAGETDEDLLSSSRSEDEALPRPLFAKSETGRPRYCRKCDAPKPDRTHHCRTCSVCVLKMDHHCVWIGTCVGYRNYKPFLLFITYATLLAVYACIESALQLVAYMTDPTPYTNDHSTPGQDFAFDFGPVIMMLLVLACGFFTLAVGSLAVYHWYLVSQNLTTLEHMSHSYPTALLNIPTVNVEDEDSSTPISPAGKPEHVLTRPERIELRETARALNCYDRGWRRNIADVLMSSSGRAHHYVDLETGQTTSLDWDTEDRRGASGGARIRQVVDGLLMAWPRTAPPPGGETFPYDVEKLRQLRALTRRMRLSDAAAERDETLWEDER